MQLLQDFHKKLGLLGLICLLMTACAETNEQPVVTAQKLAEAEALLEDAALTEAALAPEVTSAWGLDSNFAPLIKGTFSGASQAAFERQRLLRLDLQTRMAGAPVLPQDHPIGRDLLITRLALQDVILLQKTGKGNLRLGRIRPYTIDPYEGLWIEGPQTLVRDHIIETPEDADAYISRLAALSDGLQDTRRRLLADAATGHLPAVELLKQSRLKIEALIDERAFEALIETLENFSRGLSETRGRDHETRMQAANDLYETSLLPAYRELAETLENLESQAPLSLGLWTQPGGVTFYNDLIATKAGPSVNIEALWVTLEEALNDITPLAIDPKPEPEDPPTIDTSEALRLEAPAPKIVQGLLRKRDPFSSSTLTGLARLDARLDDRRPMITVWDPARLSEFPAPLRSSLIAKPRREAEALYAQTLQNVARRSAARAFTSDETFAAAWTSYYHASDAEDGEHLAAFNLETVLAAADIGIHARRWALEDAQTFIQDKTGLSAPLAKEAVLRLAANPAEAVGIYVHRERFRSLEARARQVLGTSFDPAAFHQILLKDGPRPLPLVERDVDAWYQTILATNR